MPNTTPDIEVLVRDFATRIEALVRAQMTASLSTAFATMTGGKTPAAKLSAAVPSKTVKAAKAVATPGKRKLTLTAKGLAARKLQGQYMGLLRGLQPGARLRVKKMAREQGVAAAIKFADTLK